VVAPQACPTEDGFVGGDQPLVGVTCRDRVLQGVRDVAERFDVTDRLTAPPDRGAPGAAIRTFGKTDGGGKADLSRWLQRPTPKAKPD